MIVNGQIDIFMMIGRKHLLLMSAFLVASPCMIYMSFDYTERRLERLITTLESAEKPEIGPLSFTPPLPKPYPMSGYVTATMCHSPNI